MKKFIISLLVVVGILPASSFAGISKVVKGNLINLEQHDSPSDSCEATDTCGSHIGGRFRNQK